MIEKLKKWHSLYQRENTNKGTESCCSLIAKPVMDLCIVVLALQGRTTLAENLPTEKLKINSILVSCT